MRKILYSPGYGAGWTSWEGDYEMQKFMIDYKPIVEYVDNGGTFDSKILDYRFHSDDKGNIKPEALTKMPDCLRQFITECHQKFGKIPYLSGLRDIQVATVAGPVQIKEYDGNESYTEGFGEWL